MIRRSSLSIDLRLGIDLHLDARGGLVDQVDGLVRQEAVGDVAVRQLRRGDDRRVGDLDAVVDLVLLLQAAEDRDRVLDARLVDEHLLEAAFERGVLLDVLAVLVERRRADAVHLAARERRLQHVAGVDGALGLARADHRVDLVDEHDDPALVLRDFLQHRLQAFLELAAILRAGEQRRHVEHEHALVLQRLRHLAVHDALREALDDRRLADARLADQHRVVLRAPLQDLDHAADLVIAADHRIELAVAGALGQVERVLLQRLALALGFLVLHRLAAAHGRDGLLDRGLRPAVLLQQSPRLALVVGEREQEQLGRDELVAALLRFLVGDVEQPAQLARDADLAARALDAGQPFDRALQRGAERLHVHAGALEDRRRRSVVLLEQCREEMLRLDVRAVAPDGETLGIGKRLLELRGQSVETHGVRLPWGWLVATGGGGGRRVFNGPRPCPSGSPCAPGPSFASGIGSVNRP
jgi:hypothetical protein